jgi:hypothetical protein
MRWTLAVAILLVAPLAGCLSPTEPGDGGPSDSDSQTPLLPGRGTTSTSTRTVAPERPNQTLPGGGPARGNDTGTGVQRTWATLGEATIRPGVQVVAGGSQCTSNFLFTSPDNRTAYIGFAAHCVTHEDPNNAEDGCDDASDPMDIGTKVEVEGADHPAILRRRRQ